MFKKIQKNLLINHPLLWNTKIVPLIIVLIFINIIFFILGYLNGKLNFYETQNDYDYNINADTIVFFSVVVSILTTIVWSIFYLKNNSFKSFYPKTNLSLFKEWMLILLGSFLICSFSISFFFGKDLRVRSYYSETEAKKRCETLSIASLFLDQGYGNGDFKEVDSLGFQKVVYLNYYTYRGKKYPIHSLLNKNVGTFTFFDHQSDSLREIRVKDWLVNNQQDSVKLVFKNFMKMGREHKLKSIIDEKKWFELVYNYPDFEQTKQIGSCEKSSFYNYENNQNTPVDYENQYVRTIGTTQYVYNKYYVAADELNFSYNKISQSWNNPIIDFEYFLVVLYFAFALSIILFSFRVTSVRNWLIALVSTGLIGIIVGVISAIFSNEYFFIGSVATLILILFIYFLWITYKKIDKKISGITLNGLLWLFPSFVPVCYVIAMEILKYAYGYYDKSGFKAYETPEIVKIMKDNVSLMFLANAIFIVLFMLFISIKIKKWKGIPEN